MSHEKPGKHRLSKRRQPRHGSSEDAPLLSVVPTGEEATVRQRPERRLRRVRPYSPHEEELRAVVAQLEPLSDMEGAEAETFAGPDQTLVEGRYATLERKAGEMVVKNVIPDRE